jgi:general secretion pathway protein A
LIYSEFWDFAFPPFSDENRRENFVPTRSASLVSTRLRYALGHGGGAAGLFGEPGVGKTRIAKSLLDEFSAAGWLAGYLPNPLGTPGDILAALEPSAAPRSPVGGLAELQAFAAARARSGQPAVLAVDDVQAARGTDFLEIVRTLLNIEYGGRRSLSLLLIGQPGMERRLAAASSFNTRLDARAVLSPMTDEEARLYILARLKAAGSRQGIFTRQAAENLVRLGKGNPRQLNRLCELSLVVAYGLESEKVGPEIVEMAAGDLDLLPAGDAGFLPWPHPAGDGDGEKGEAEPGEEDILAALPGADRGLAGPSQGRTA